MMRAFFTVAAHNLTTDKTVQKVKEEEGEEKVREEKTQGNKEGPGILLVLKKEWIKNKAKS